MTSGAAVPMSGLQLTYRSCGSTYCMYLFSLPKETGSWPPNKVGFIPPCTRFFMVGMYDNAERHVDWYDWMHLVYVGGGFLCALGSIPADLPATFGCITNSSYHRSSLSPSCVTRNAALSLKILRLRFLVPNGFESIASNNWIRTRVQDDGSWPVPPIESQVKAFNPKMMEGQWYISAGLNPAFDCFDCQVRVCVSHLHFDCV